MFTEVFKSFHSLWIESQTQMNQWNKCTQLYIFLNNPCNRKVPQNCQKQNSLDTQNRNLLLSSLPEGNQVKLYLFHYRRCHMSKHPDVEAELQHLNHSHQPKKQSNPKTKAPRIKPVTVSTRSSETQGFLIYENTLFFCIKNKLCMLKFRLSQT